MAHEHERKPHQMNVRLDREQADKLACMEFIDVTSGPEILRQLLEEASADYAELYPEIEAFAPFRTSQNEVSDSL